jgi:hypothetical protein
MFTNWPTLLLVPVPYPRWARPDTLGETARLIDAAPPGTKCACGFEAVRATHNYDPVAYYACMACLWSEWWWNEGRDEGTTWDQLTDRLKYEHLLGEAEDLLS